MVHTPMDVRAAIVAAALVGAGAASAEDAAAPSGRSGVAGYDAAWSHANGLPGAELRHTPAHLLIHAPSERAVYLFTKWSHAAHPAYMRTEILDIDGRSAVAVDLVATGDVPAAEAWADQWEALMRAELAGPSSTDAIAAAAASMIESTSAPEAPAGS